MARLGQSISSGRGRVHVVSNPLYHGSIFDWERIRESNEPTDFSQLFAKTPQYGFYVHSYGVVKPMIEVEGEEVSRRVVPKDER